MKRFLSILVGVLLSVFAFGKAQADVVGYWPVNEGSGSVVKDISPNRNDGNISGGTWVIDGGRPVLKFDGIDDYVQGASTGLPIGNSARTVSAWVKSTASTPTYPAGAMTANDSIVSYGTGWAQGVSMVLNYSNYWVNIGCWSDDLSVNIDPILGYWVNNGNWHQIMVTIDGTTQRLYVDGQAVGSRTLNMPLATPAGTPLYFGRTPWGDQWMDGLLKEIIIVDEALTPQDVKDLSPELRLLTIERRIDDNLAQLNAIPNGLSEDDVKDIIDGAIDGNAATPIAADVDAKIAGATADLATIGDVNAVAGAHNTHTHDKGSSGRNTSGPSVTAPIISIE